MNLVELDPEIVRTGKQRHVVAILTGVISLRQSVMRESQFGKVTSNVRSWIGIGTGAVGLILGGIFLVMFLINQ